jgi:hypothetical protein
VTLLALVLLDATNEQEQGAALTGLVDAAWEAGEPLLALDLIRRGGTWEPGRERSKWRDTPLGYGWCEDWAVSYLERHLPFEHILNLLDFQLKLMHKPWHTYHDCSAHQTGACIASRCLGQVLQAADNAWGGHCRY